MTDATNNGNETTNERRTSVLDRRNNAERRSKERLAHMRGECRSNAPRRQLDVAGKMVEGELWWSGSQRFF